MIKQSKNKNSVKSRGKKIGNRSATNNTDVKKVGSKNSTEAGSEKIEIPERFANCLLTYSASEDQSYEKFLATEIEDEDSEPIIATNSHVQRFDITAILEKINSAFDDSERPADYVEPVISVNSAMDKTADLEVEIL